MQILKFLKCKKFRSDYLKFSRRKLRQIICPTKFGDDECFFILQGFCALALAYLDNFIE